MDSYIVTDAEIYGLIFESPRARNDSAQFNNSGAEQAQLTAVYIGTLRFLSETYAADFEAPELGGSTLSLPVRMGQSYAFTIKKFGWDAFKHAVTTLSGFVCMAAGEYVVGGATSAVGMTEFTINLLRNFHRLSPSGQTVMLAVTSHYITHHSFPSKEQIVQAVPLSDASLSAEEVAQEVDMLLKLGILVTHDIKLGLLRPGV